jgi:hypothetical protein
MTLVMSSLILSLRSKPLEWIFPENCDLLLHQAVRRASRPHRPVARQYFQSLRSKPLMSLLQRRVTMRLCRSLAAPTGLATLSFS